MKKRAREAAPRAKMARIQRKQFRFWKGCFRPWGVMHKYLKELLRAFRSRIDGGQQVHICVADAFALSQDWKRESNGMLFAPRFHSDGRVSVLQHGEAQYLPRNDFTACIRFAGRRDPLVVEGQLALALRCRLGMPRMQCLYQEGCSIPSVLQHRFDHECPLKPAKNKLFCEFLRAKKEGKETCADFESWSRNRVRHGRGVTLPKAGSARRFLCNSQCPLRCCTLKCPWRYVTSVQS